MIVGETGKRQVLDHRRAAMLFSDNVIDLVRNRRKPLRQLAILTAAPRSRTDLCRKAFARGHSGSRSLMFKRHSRRECRIPSNDPSCS